MEKTFIYLERLCTLLRAEMRAAAKAHGLHPVQLQMLHYLSQCNRYSDTPTGVREYLGLTKGTVSQSLNVLEGRELLEKVPDARDSRSVHLHVTERGQNLLDEVIPSLMWGGAGEEVEEIAPVLDTLLQTIQRNNQHKSFGTCYSCRYHLVEGKNQFRCGLTQEALQPRETTLICREHEEVLA